MLKRTLLVVSSLSVLISLAARPATAYPTAIGNVPTGKVEEPGQLRVETYTSATLDRKPYLQNGVAFGALPGLELGGVPGIGALELGLDTYGSNEVFNGKLQLFGETLLVPAVSMGALNMPLMGGPSENFVYGVMTKEVGPEDMSSGSWSFGAFNTSPSGSEEAPQMGVMGGASFPVLSGLSLAADFMTGTTSISGANVLLIYEVAPSAYLCGGYYFHHSDSSANVWFFGADLYVPTGLFGQRPAVQED